MMMRQKKQQQHLCDHHRKIEEEEGGVFYFAKLSSFCPRDTNTFTHAYTTYGYKEIATNYILSAVRRQGGSVGDSEMGRKDFS